MEKLKKKGGRTPKSPDLIRNKRSIRFLSSEFTEISTQFSYSGERHLGEFLFKKVTHKPISKPSQVSFPAELNRDFKALGNNINQIAAVLNSKKNDSLAPEMLSQLKLIAKQYQFLVDRISIK